MPREFCECFNAGPYKRSLLNILCVEACRLKTGTKYKGDGPVWNVNLRGYFSSRIFEGETIWIILKLPKSALEFCAPTERSSRQIG